jgi:hypothetical protein
MTSCNNRTAAGSGVATRTVPLQWNMWYHATHINRRAVLFLLGPLRGYIIRSTELVRQWDRRQAVRTWSREHGSWGMYGVESRYQATTGEDTADWEDLVRAVMNCRVCELAIALYLLVVTICKCSISAVTYRNRVCGRSYMWQYCSTKLSMRNTFSFPLGRKNTLQEVQLQYEMHAEAKWFKL